MYQGFRLSKRKICSLLVTFVVRNIFSGKWGSDTNLLQNRIKLSLFKSLKQTLKHIAEKVCEKGNCELGLYIFKSCDIIFNSSPLSFVTIHHWLDQKMNSRKLVPRFNYIFIQFFWNKVFNDFCCKKVFSALLS